MTTYAFGEELFDASSFDSIPESPSVAVETDLLHDGTLSVTGAGHDLTGRILPGLSFSNTNPGGFGEATFSIEALDAYGPYAYHAGHDMTKGDAIEITHGLSGVVLFQGEITNDVSHAVVEGGFAYYDVTAAGLWWKAGLRKDYCKVWSDTDTSQWYERSRNGQFKTSTEGEVEVRLEKGQNAKANVAKSLYYWVDGGMGYSTLTSMMFTAEVDVPSSGPWYADISTATSPYAASGDWTVDKEWHNTTVAAGEPFCLTFAGVVRGVRVRLYADTDVTGVADDRLVSLSRVALCHDVESKTISSNTAASPSVVTTSTAHGLKVGDRVFVYGSNSNPDIDGWHDVATTPLTTTFTMTGVNVATTGGTAGTVYRAQRIDEAMADIAVTTGLASTSDLQTGGIGNANWGLAIRPHMSRAEAIEYLAATHSAPIDYGFWDSADFYCQERGAAPTTCTYTIDASDPAVDFAVFKDTEDSPTTVKVLYTFRDVDGGTSIYPDGTIRAVYRPSEPTWADASQWVDVWDEWQDLVLETGQAEDLGDQILAWIDDNQYQGTITVAAPTLTLGAGGTRNAAYARAGEWVLEPNLNIKLPITSVNVDVDSGVTTLGIGESRAEFVARIGKRWTWKHGAPIQPGYRHAPTPFKRPR